MVGRDPGLQPSAMSPLPLRVTRDSQPQQQAQFQPQESGAQVNVKLQWGKAPVESKSPVEMADITNGPQPSSMSPSHQETGHQEHRGMFNSSFAMEVQAAERVHPDPVINLAENLVKIITDFQATYQSRGEPRKTPLPSAPMAPAAPAHLQPVRSQAHQPIGYSNPQEGRDLPNHPPPPPSTRAPQNLPQAKHQRPPAFPVTNLSPVNPDTEWLGDTRDGLNAQLEVMGNMGGGEEMEEEHITMSVVRQEITAQMNDLLDSVNHSIETKIRKRDSQVSVNKETICKLISDSQSKDQEIVWLKEGREHIVNKLINLERRLKNIEKRENRGGREEVTNVARQPYIAADQPAIRKEDADLPSLPEPARPNDWANNWQTVGTKPKRRTSQQAVINSQHPANGKFGNTAPISSQTGQN